MPGIPTEDTKLTEGESVLGSELAMTSGVIMLSIVSMQEVLSDLRLVYHHALDCHEEPASDQVIRAFGPLCVAGIQMSPISFGLNRPQITFGHSEVRDRFAEAKVFPREELYLASNISPDMVTMVEERFAAALDVFDQLPGECGSLLRTIIQEVAVFRISLQEAGSHSSMIGVAYLVPRREWPVKKYMDVLFQQVIHNVVFLRDMVRGILPNLSLLYLSENRCYSATRDSQCPFESSFHSACVAAGRMWLNRQLVDFGFDSAHSDNHGVRCRGRRAVEELQAAVQRNNTMGHPILADAGVKILIELAAFFDDPECHCVAA